MLSFVTDTSTTFADAWERWLAYRRVSPRPLRLSTLADYRSAYRCHLAPRLAQMALHEIDGSVIVALVVELGDGGIAAKRLSNVLVPLRACLNWHHRMGTFARDPAPWFDATAPGADERRILTLAQVEALVAATPGPFRMFVMTAAYTGMRCGELRALTWADLDLTRRTASVDKTYFREHLQRSTKTGQNRVVPLPPHVADALEAWRETCPASGADLVFPRASGRPIDADDFRRRVFRPAAERAGLPAGLRFHDLRHTSASLHLQHGATVAEVMEIHGWRQLQTAMRYLHTGEELARSAQRLSEARERECGVPPP